jgi:TM2 domain-containing membrane protein YozV
MPGRNDAAAPTWSPGIAAALSLVIPGAGQTYKGSAGAGLAWLTGIVIVYLLFVPSGVVIHLICILNAALGASPGIPASVPSAGRDVID